MGENKYNLEDKNTIEIEKETAENIKESVVESEIVVTKEPNMKEKFLAALENFEHDSLFNENEGIENKIGPLSLVYSRSNKNESTVYGKGINLNKQLLYYYCTFTIILLIH